MRFAAIATMTALLAAPVFAGGLFDDDDCKYTAPRHASTPAAGITKVVIHAEAGSLKVDGTNGASQIAVAGTACSSEEDFLSRMTLTLRKVGSELHITTNIPDKTVMFGFFSARLDFTVTMPAGLPVSIEDGSGSISVANVGATSIEDGSGSIEVRNVRGALSINDSSGSIDVDNVTGAVTIDDGSGEIIVKNITGSVAIEDGSGAISIARADSVHVRDDGSGSISVQNVRRDVIIDDDGSGSIDVADIGGNFTVGRKGSGSIDHERVAGRVDVPRGR